MRAAIASIAWGRDTSRVERVARQSDTGRHVKNAGQPEPDHEATTASCARSAPVHGYPLGGHVASVGRRRAPAPAGTRSAADRARRPWAAARKGRSLPGTPNADEALLVRPGPLAALDEWEHRDWIHPASGSVSGHGRRPRRRRFFCGRSCPRPRQDRRGSSPAVDLVDRAITADSRPAPCCGRRRNEPWRSLMPRRCCRSPSRSLTGRQSTGRRSSRTPLPRSWRSSASCASSSTWPDGTGASRPMRRVGPRRLRRRPGAWPVCRRRSGIGRTWRVWRGWPADARRRLSRLGSPPRRGSSEPRPPAIGLGLRRLQMLQFVT